MIISIKVVAIILIVFEAWFYAKNFKLVVYKTAEMMGGNYSEYRSIVYPIIKTIVIFLGIIL